MWRTDASKLTAHNSERRGNTEKSSRDSADAGSVMLLTFLVTTLISAVGLGLITLSGTERAIAGNHQAGVQLLYAAEAMAERVLVDLKADLRWTEALGGVWRSSFVASTAFATTDWGESIDVGAATADLQDETDAASLWGPNTPRWVVFASGSLSDAGRRRVSWRSGLLIAWIADDRSEIDANPATDSNGIVLVTAQAIGPRGLRRTVQVAVGRGGAASGVRILSWREVR